MQHLVDQADPGACLGETMDRADRPDRWWAIPEVRTRFAQPLLFWVFNHAAAGAGFGPPGHHQTREPSTVNRQATTLAFFRTVNPQTDIAFAGLFVR